LGRITTSNVDGTYGIEFDDGDVAESTLRSKIRVAADVALAELEQRK
jgi:hypothetical protein